VAAVIIRPLPPTKSLYPAVNFLMTRIRCLIKFLSWKKKKKPCLESFSPFRVESGVKVGSTVRALCHFLSLDVMALAKRNK